MRKLFRRDTSFTAILLHPGGHATRYRVVSPFGLIFPFWVGPRTVPLQCYETISHSSTGRRNSVDGHCLLNALKHLRNNCNNFHERTETNEYQEGNSRSEYQSQKSETRSLPRQSFKYVLHVHLREYNYSFMMVQPWQIPSRLHFRWTEMQYVFFKI